MPPCTLTALCCILHVLCGAFIGFISFYTIISSSSTGVHSSVPTFFFVCVSFLYLVAVHRWYPHPAFIAGLLFLLLVLLGWAFISFIAQYSVIIDTTTLSGLPHCVDTLRWVSSASAWVAISGILRVFIFPSQCFRKTDALVFFFSFFAAFSGESSLTLSPPCVATPSPSWLSVQSGFRSTAWNCPTTYIQRSE